MANKHMKRCYTSYIIGEMKNKTTTRYKYTAIKTDKIQNSEWWRGCRATGIPIHSWWEHKMAQPLWKTVWQFFPNETYSHHMFQPSHSLEFTQRSWKLCHTETCTWIFFQINISHSHLFKYKRQRTSKNWSNCLLTTFNRVNTVVSILHFLNPEGNCKCHPTRGLHF